ncbi:MAG: 50S ribosomal protein L29 [Bacteroidota bacterium]
MKNSEIRELTTKELIEKIEDEKALFARMKLNHAISPLDNPNKLKEGRRLVAKLKTELRKRELTENQE